MLTVVLLIVVLIYLMYCNNVDGFSAKPNTTNAKQYAKHILDNRELFLSNTLVSAKTKFNWVDPIVYEDARHLLRNNVLDLDTIAEIFK